MKTISLSVLCSRFLTPLQDCKICANLDSDDPESAQEECKSSVLVCMDGLLLDAESLMEDETDTETKKYYKEIIITLINFKKACFNCNCAVPTMFNLYNEIGGDLESCKSDFSAEKSDKRKTVTSIYSLRKKHPAE